MSVAALFEQALAHHQAGRLPQAEQIYRQILAAESGHVDAYHFLGLLAHQVGHPDGIPMLRRSLEVQPDNAVFLNNLGGVFNALGQYGEAARCYRRAVQIDPVCADAHCNLAHVQLLHGDFDEGWREFEWRWQTPGINSFRIGPECPQPRWDGGPVPGGRRLLIHTEQGLGDALQFMRYLPMVAARAPEASLLLLCSPDLALLLRRSLTQEIAVISTVARDGFDAWLPLMSLPLLFHTGAGNIPPVVPLVPDRQAAQRWDQRLAADRGRFRVGLVWAGSRIHPHDRQRSMGLAPLEPLGAVGGLSFYSLQKGEETRQAAGLPGLGLEDFSGEWRDFDDTAAFVANLDLVITVDTAVAHLAGSMGKPTWILLPFMPDWRWLLEREDSPWYPAVRLFRQTALGDWAGVVAQVAQALALAAPRPVSET